MPSSKAQRDAKAEQERQRLAAEAKKTELHSQVTDKLSAFTYLKHKDMWLLDKQGNNIQVKRDQDNYIIFMSINIGAHSIKLDNQEDIADAMEHFGIEESQS